jgi:hypothetical protein
LRLLSVLRCLRCDGWWARCLLLPSTASIQDASQAVLASVASAIQREAAS